MSDRESVEAIVADAATSRANLAELDHMLQDEIDDVVLAAAREGRALSPADNERRRALRADQSEVQDAFKALAFVTLARLNQSAELVALEAKLTGINAVLADDLDRLRSIQRYAAIAAKVADGLAQLAAKVATAIAKGGL
jgi:hypothetical protein